MYFISLWGYAFKSRTQGFNFFDFSCGFINSYSALTYRVELMAKL